MNSDKDFFQSLDPKDGTVCVRRVLERFSPLPAATVGLDGKPQIRPADYAYEQDGAFWFLTLKSSRMYAELSKTPYIQLYASDGETGTVFRLSAKVCFSEDEGAIDRAAVACPRTLEDAGGERKMLIAFFLLGVQAEMSSRSEEIAVRSIRLPDPAGVLIGITIKKKTELRDRLIRVLERREAEPLPAGEEATKLYDGALFVFAEAAKALWPRMDIRPIERAAVFETWDEREKYTALAASLIGNAVIESPEDITYWLNPETLMERRARQEI